MWCWNWVAGKRCWSGCWGAKYWVFLWRWSAIRHPSYSGPQWWARESQFWYRALFEKPTASEACLSLFLMWRKNRMKLINETVFLFPLNSTLKAIVKSRSDMLVWDFDILKKRLCCHLNVLCLNELPRIFNNSIPNIITTDNHLISCWEHFWNLW